MAVGTYEVTHKKILESGLKLFLKNGYERTNLRELCKSAGITTGAFYRHFDSKENIFGALVEPAIVNMKNIYYHSEKQCFDTYEKENPKETFDIYYKTVSKWIHCIYDNYDCFKLLLQCSDGTRYSSFVNELVELEDKNTIKLIEILKNNNIKINEISHKELHICNYTYFSSMFETVLQGYTEQEALVCSKTMVDFFYAGWQRILGL